MRSKNEIVQNERLKDAITNEGSPGRIKSPQFYQQGCGVRARLLGGTLCVCGILVGGYLLAVALRLTDKRRFIRLVARWLVGSIILFEFHKFRFTTLLLCRRVKS